MIIINVAKCLECLALTREDYGSLRNNPCLECLDQEREELETKKQENDKMNKEYAI